MIPQQDYYRVKVTPKSPKTQIKEILEDGTIKIALKAAPEKGQANSELIKFLSIKLALPENSITILAGKSERTKLIKVKWNQ